MPSHLRQGLNTKRTWLQIKNPEIVGNANNCCLGQISKLGDLPTKQRILIACVIQIYTHNFQQWCGICVFCCDSPCVIHWKKLKHLWWYLCAIIKVIFYKPNNNKDSKTTHCSSSTWPPSAQFPSWHSHWGWISSQTPDEHSLLLGIPVSFCQTLAPVMSNKMVYMALWQVLISQQV